MNENKNKITWDELFIEMAKLVSKRSSDPHTQVGAVLVKNKRILSIGYNGPIQDFKLDFDWSTSEKYDFVIHAEENALANAAKIGANVEGADVYLTLSPCNHCIKLLIQSGIKTVYYLEQYKDFELTRKIAENSKIKLVQIKGKSK